MADTGQHHAISEMHRAAMATARTSPAEYVPRHVTKHDIRMQVHGAGAVAAYKTPARSLAFSPVGRLLATASFDRTAKIWQGRRLVRVLKAPDNISLYRLFANN